MKRGFPFLVMALTAWALMPQQWVENPEIPAVKAAKLKEIWRLSDAGGAALVHPGYIQVANDGSIFVSDEKGLLKISADGKYQKNILKLGQGAGQLPQLSVYQVDGDHLILHSAQPPKVVEVDLEGNLVQEIRYNLRGGARLLFKNQQLFYLLAFNFDFDRIRSGDKTQDQVVISFGADGRISETGISFQVTLPDKVLELGGGAMVKTAITQPVMAVRLADRNMYVACTPEYGMEKVDFKSKQQVLKFRRKYQRVPFYTYGQSPAAGAVPGRFFVDIMKLLARGSQLWVVTSTADAAKGVLVDVFEANGRYSDCFWLPLPGIKTPYDIRPAEISVSGDYLYAVETGERGNPALVKYQISF